jgi:glycosyltransferase involved in cell wall biosynthesis
MKHQLDMKNNMFGKPSVDVIVPVFNGELYLEAAIRSVLSQTYPVNKLILCDDGSEDGTAQICQRFESEHENVLYRRLPKSGVSAARNAGIAASYADLVAFIDADDIWLDTKLEVQVQVLANSGPRVGFVHSSYFFIDAQGNQISSEGVVPPRLSGNIFLPLVLENYTLSGSASSVLVRRDILDEAGYFDERLFYGEDWDLWMRLAKLSDVNFTPDAVVGIRVHNRSVQRKDDPARSIEFFKQLLLVFSKWESVWRGNPRFSLGLKRRAVETILPFWRRPKYLREFYKKISESDISIAGELFVNELDFWFSVLVALCRIFCRRVVRKVGMK